MAADGTQAARSSPSTRTLLTLPVGDVLESLRTWYASERHVTGTGWAGVTSLQSFVCVTRAAGGLVNQEGPSCLQGEGTGHEMSSVERDLLLKLRRLYDEYERLNRNIREANQRHRFLKDPEEIARAAHQEQQLLTEINRLMDRLRAVEGQLMQVRKTGRRRFQ
jgi:hypothetical protein